MNESEFDKALKELIVISKTDENARELIRIVYSLFDQGYQRKLSQNN